MLTATDLIAQMIANDDALRGFIEGKAADLLEDNEWDEVLAEVDLAPYIRALVAEELPEFDAPWESLIELSLQTVEWDEIARVYVKRIVDYTDREVAA